MRHALVCCLAVALPACSGAPPTAAVSQPIVAGQSDSADTSVLLFIAQVPGSSTASLCTAEVLSPHVVLTAAHCVAPDAVGANAEFAVMTAADLNSSTRSDFITVGSTHYDPDFVFDISAIEQNGHDIAVGIVSAALPQAPLSFNHTPFGGSYVKKQARIVGYGINSGSDSSGTSAGVRRQGTVDVTAVTDIDMTLIGKTYDDCEGDSGGPAFVNVAGLPVIAGITSFGDKDCTVSAGAVDTNVSHYADLIDGWVDAVDPRPANGMLGDACQINRDCASNICGNSGGASNFCTQACDPNSSSSCPADYHCADIDDDHFCAPGKASHGCDVGGEGAPAAPALLLVGGALALLRRRRSRA